MGDGNESDIERLKQSFNKVLNRHGHGFQYSILRKAWDISGQGSRWIFKAAEFPVEVQGAGTRIDFILARVPDYRFQGGFYLAAECKRANPALSNWCFARPLRPRGSHLRPRRLRPTHLGVRRGR